MSSEAQNQAAVDKWLPIGLFVSFFAAVVYTTLFYGPSWGLMDDFGLLQMAMEFKANPRDFHVVSENFIISGMLRPFYYSWAAVFYGVFEHWPTGFYIFVAACNMTAMIFWGTVFYNLFAVRREDRLWTVFFYPLTFFIFTPFWNIFTYLSLQEKFIVFFAPLSIYFFQKVYRQFSVRDIVLLYVCMLMGLMSKATFVYIPFVFFAYSLLDVAVFRYKPKLSLVFMLLNGIIFAAYAVFTLTFQIQGNYTSKYKSGLEAGTFLTKLIQLPFLMKSFLLIGVLGSIVLFVFVILKKKQDRSLGLILYMALICYVVLLLPWGFQSYLISAMGPLALGALFPVYGWLNGKGGGVKLGVNILIVLLVCFSFGGNIVPSIARMGDIRQAMVFLRAQPEGEADIYFMPPGYPESAYATGKFTQRKIEYCAEGKITAGMLSAQGSNYVILTDLFPSIVLSGVKTEGREYANGTWQIFKIISTQGHEEKFEVPFKKTLLQQLKVRIRDM